MIAGASWTWWLGFHAAVAAVLVADSFMPGHRSDAKHPQVMAWVTTGALAAASAGFAVWLGVTSGRQTALEFVGGWAIETSLSVDNLFIFLVIFQGFRISTQKQHAALLWGVMGAVVLRALFILAGVSLLKRFEWVTYIFGVFLLYAAFRLVRGGSAHAAVPEWIRKLQPAKGSNIAAVLGLRSLYFALAALLDRFKYLHYGLGAMLAFVAMKMLAARWLEIPITWSLVVMGAILSVCAVASWLAAEKDGAKAI